MHNDADNSATGLPTDPLDELLHSASWPDESSDRLDELLRMAEWPEEVAELSVKRHSAWTRFACTAAATILVGLTLWSLSVRRNPVSSDVATTIAPTATPQPSVSGTNTVVRDSRSHVASQTVPEAATSRRPATRINPPDLTRAIAPGELRLRMLLARSLPPAASEIDKVIHRFIAHRLAQPDGDLATLVEPLSSRRTEIERRLLDCFGSLAGAQESAAIELLGHIGSEASVPLLLRMRLKPSTHEPSVRALLELADARTLSRLLRSEADPTLRKDVAAALRAKADQQTLLFTLATEGDLSCREFGSMRLRSAESL